MRYYNLAGDYGSDEINLVYNYYDIPYVPYAIFGGLEEIGGGGEDIASGEPYLQIVEEKYFEPSPLKLEITDFNKVEGTISVTATMFSSTVSVEDASIRFILLEDDVYDIYTHVTRDIIKDDFNLSGQGNTISYDKPFVMSHNWNSENLHAVVFVQMPNKQIIQATSTYPIPQYKVRALVPFDTNYYDADFVENSNYVFESDSLAIVNYGLEDNLNITLVEDEIPTDWNLNFSDAENSYENFTSFSLSENDYKQFRYSMQTESYGTARFHFEITSANADYLYEIPFSYTNIESSVEQEEFASQTVLHQNYPNPFRTSTTISFQFSNEQNQQYEQKTIEIYNIKGQKVKELKIGNYELGINQVIWDGKNEQGNEVSSGIYFYKLTKNSQNIMRKMVLIK